ncbi:MAG: polyprenyl synthetase family protein [Byssovorax sp.]
MTTSSRLVPQVLEEYGAATRSVLFRYLPDAEPRRYLYDLVADYPRRGGRALRPSLCIATARAFGGKLEDAVLTAASIEMLHNALLIHDDIEDESTTRRGQPTMHARWGVPLAINAGDVLTLMSLRPLFDNRRLLGPRLAMQILEETERMSRESGEGQALELGWRHDNVVDIDERDYMGMVVQKTCWLTTIHPSRVGALIGTGGGIDLDPFIRFGCLFGLAFQIQDDVLNLIGNEAAYGKELDGDIHEGKRTLMLIHLLENADGDDRRQVTDLISRPRSERTPEDVRWVRERMDAHGCIDYARQVASGLVGAALAEFDATYGRLPPSRDKDFIEELVTWVIERT